MGQQIFEDFRRCLPGAYERVGIGSPMVGKGGKNETAQITHYGGRGTGKKSELIG